MHAAGAVATAALLLPALGFAAGSAALRARRPSSGRPSASRTDFPDDDYVPRVITHDAGHRRGRQDDRLHARAATPTIDDVRDPTPPETDAPFIAISSRCMHLGCPVRWTPAAAALHLPVPRRRLRLPRRGLRRPAGPPARSLLHPHAQRPGRGRPALLGQLRSSSASRATAIRASRSTASASTSTPAASRPRRTHETADASQAPDPQALPGLRRRARARPRRPSRSSRPRKPASAPPTGSTSAPRCPAACAG